MRIDVFLLLLLLAAPANADGQFATSSSPTPTTEGLCEWDSDDDELKCGDGNSGTVSVNDHPVPFASTAGSATKLGDKLVFDFFGLAVGLDGNENGVTDAAIGETTGSFLNLVCVGGIAPTAGAGECIGWDDTDGFYHDDNADGDKDAGEAAIAMVDSVVADQKDFSILGPADGDDHVLGKQKFEITVTDIECIVDPADASGDSITLTIRECDSTADNCTAIESAITCDNDGGADDGTIDHAVIDAGNWIDVQYGTPSGTVDGLAYSIHFTRQVVE